MKIFTIDSDTEDIIEFNFKPRKMIRTKSIDAMICMYKEKHSTEELLTDTNLENIIGIVLRYFKITREDFVSERRFRNLTTARHFYCGLARAFTTLTLKTISFGIGKRDHSTIIHSVKTLDAILAERKSLWKAYANMKAEIMSLPLPYPDDYTYVPVLSKKEVNALAYNERKERQAAEQRDREETVGDKIEHVRDNHFSYNGDRKRGGLD